MSELETSKTSSATLESKLEVDFRSKMDRTQLQVIIGTTTQVENPTEEIENKVEQDTSGKTNEDDSNVEQTNSKTSRELKLLLALSKEANLETNISHKRKTLDSSKSKEKESSPKISSVEVEPKKLSKVAYENRNIRYPITAESELELELQGCEINNGTDNSPKTAKRKRDSLSEVNTGGATEEASKRNKKSSSNEINMFKPNKDMFCWRCHREGVNISCETCPRSYHQRCLKQTINNVEHWPCPECVAILKAESTQTRSEAMKGMTLEHLCSLLKFAVHRMIQCQGSEPFLHPVNDAEFPSYKKYIIQPMDLTKLEKNIKGNLYGSTQACEADAKWLLHNSIIFNSYQSKLTTSAKNIIKICKQEMAEIENCPSCYLNANTKKGTWFVEVCPKPHLLVWAKLKGFPYWPAKAMCTNSAGMVDVRFFGAHDRAWVHYKDCFLFSEKDPNTFKQKRYDIEKCVEELNVYIKNLQKIYGEFRYAPFRTLLDPGNELKQLQMFLPKYKSFTTPKKRESFKSGNIETKAEVKENKKETKSDNLEKKVESKESTQNNTETKTKVVEKQTKTTNLEAKENIPEPKEDENTQKESSAAEEPDLLQDSNSIYKSTFDDNDTIMEGYGTDDDTNPGEIDLERRKTFIDKKSDQSLNNVSIEEDEDDTQVPSNISVDNVRGAVRTRGGHNNNTGKLKVLPRRTSEQELTQKRQSLDEMSHSPQKMSRRNSDQSVKSDSSRISNISDKINRVDISENMEVTLGNEDVGCISISENISSSKSDSSKGSDYSIENKRKPVQVDIENAEFTISPSNKLKIADKLMKRLSDGDSAEEGSKSDDSKKTTVEKKSPTDLLIEKFKGVIEREIVNFGQTSSVSEEKSAESSLSDKESESLCQRGEIPTSAEAAQNVDSHENTATEKSCSSSKDGTSGAKDSTTSEKDHTTPDVNVQAEDKSAEEKTNATTDKTADATRIPSVSSNDKPPQSSRDSLVPSKETVDEGSTNCKKTNKIEIVQAINIPKPSTLSVKTPAEKKIFSTIEPKNKAIPNVVKESSPQKEQQAVTKKQINLIQPAITEFTTLTNNNEIRKEDTNQNEPKKPIETNNSTKEPEDPKTAPKDVTKKPVNRDVMNIIEEFEDSEEADLIDSIEIDKTNIFNIIHSSLSETKRKEAEKDAEKPAVDRTESSAKKRKHSSDETITTQSKLVKLVSIESILNKNGEKEKKDTDSSVPKTLQGKKMIRKPSSTNTTPRSSISRQSSVQEITMEDIKSEPETDDDFSESENLEAKKKYLSALNISEKISDAEKQNRANEIRTRAKAEEKREKFRVVDNLTKVIDDVALNYSANNEGKEIRTKNMEKKSIVSPEGEIFVKSFAKIPAPKQRARKSFPMPSYVKPSPQFSILRKESSPNTVAQKRESLKSSIVTTACKAISSTVTSTVTPIVQPQKTTESGNSSSLPRVILLPPNQTITYNGTLGSLSKVSTVVSAPASTSIMLPQPTTTTITSKPKSTGLNIVASQNYIPQNESANKSPVVNNTILNELLTQPIPTTSQEPPPQQTQQQVEQITAVATTTVNTVETTNEAPQEDEFNVLNSILPENVSKAVGDLLLRPPPRLKPRPPGMLSDTFDEGIPSSAGNVTSRINSVAHRLGDYLRGMLIETLEDLGKAPNPEAKITSLQLELENLKHRHAVELSEMRKNICTVLKDIQKSIVEDREKIVDETRTACETETIKRVELAKSKQWCANCSKEAQFYCCWNTSYCDYPCQQKHWPQHLGKCTQNVEKTTGAMTMRAPGQQLILRPTTIPPKPGVGRVVAKPTKVYMNRAPGQPSAFKTQLTSGNHLTVIETTPGNYELVGNGPIAVTGKILATTSNIFHSKFKTANMVSVSSPSTSRTVDSRIGQRPTIVSESSRTLPTVSNTSTTLATNLLNDDSD